MAILTRRNRFRWSRDAAGGHVSWGRSVLYYGENAMHGALNLWLPWRKAYLCVHPTTRTFGSHWPWYVYLSPDATPCTAYWGIGPGFDGGSAEERAERRLRRGYA